MLDQALTYTRSLVAELSPHILYQFGLSQSLVWLGEQMKQHGLEVAVKTMAPSFTLPDDQAVLLFFSRFANCSLMSSNMPKSTAPPLPSTWMRTVELWICVEDEGAGFDVTDLSVAKNTR